MTAFKTLCLGLLALLPAAASASPLDLAALIECRQSVADYRAVGPVVADPLKQWPMACSRCPRATSS